MQYHELKKFAQWFNQDFEILFNDTQAGANAYLNTLSIKDKQILSNEVTKLLQELPGKDHKGLKNAWIRLGAQWWCNDAMPPLLKKLSKDGSQQ